MDVHDFPGHVFLRQDGGEGEVQPVQHLRVRAGEAVLAVNGRAVLLHGHSAELQGRRGRAAVEPVLQLRLHLLIGDVGVITVVGEICVAPPAFTSTTERDLIVPVGGFFILIIIGVLHSIHQRVAVFNIGVRVVHLVEVIVLHLAVGSDGHRPADGILTALRHLHKGVAVFHKERVVRLSHQLGKPALIAEHNTAHQPTGPNAGAFAGIFLQRHGRGALDRAAGIALVQRGPAHAGDAAHAQVGPSLFISDAQHDVRYGGAAGDIHVGRAHQAAHAAAAPAGFVLPVVLNGVAGHRAVGKGGGDGVSRPGPGKAHQPAQAVPVLPVSGILDNAAPVGVHDDVPKLCAGGEAEQPRALGTAGDGNVADGVVLPVKAAREEGGAGLGVRTFYFHDVLKAADGRKVVLRLAHLDIGVHVVRLRPVQPLSAVGDKSDGRIAPILPLVIFYVGSVLRLIPHQIGVSAPVVSALVVLERHLLRRTLDGGGSVPFNVVPVDILQLAHGAHLIRLPRRARLGGIAELCVGDAIQTHSIGEERAQRVYAFRAAVCQRPCAVGFHGGQIQTVAGLICPGGVGHELILRHLRVQCIARRFVFHAQVAVFKLAECRPGCRAVGLVEVAVAVLRHHAAVVMLGAQGAAGEPIAFLRADVAQVIARVAALLPLPVEHAHRADVPLHGPRAVVYGFARRVPYHGGIGIGVAGGQLGKAVQALALQLLSLNGPLGRVDVEAVAGCVIGV